MGNNGRRRPIYMCGWSYSLLGGLHIHYNDVIMREIASQITSLTIVYSIVYSDADQRKHQSSASLAFVRGIHRGPGNSPHKWTVTRKKFPFDDVIMFNVVAPSLLAGSNEVERVALDVLCDQVMDFHWDYFNLTYPGGSDYVSAAVSHEHSHRKHDAIISSLWRQNDVATSFWRHNDVIFASCVRWV